MKLVSGLLLIAVAAASPEIRYFRYERPLQIAGQRSGQACLALDPGLFAQASPGLGDLRLYKDGTETPYAIRVDEPVEGAEKTIPALNLGVRGKETVFDAEMPDANYSDLQLDVAAQDFIATVVVSGSRTMSGSAGTRLGAYTIFDLTRQRLGRSTVLHLPQSDFPYLHFRIAGPLAPKNITGLSVERMPAGQPKYEAVSETAQIIEKGHASIVEFVVPAHVPVDRILFVPGEAPALFSRDVEVRVASTDAVPQADGAEPPQPVETSGNILRVHNVENGHRIDEERLAIDEPGVELGTPEKWTVTIDNGDDRPLSLKSVRLEMLQRNLCFEAAAPAGYALFYGDSALTAPRYDYATLFVRQADTLAATTGPEQANLHYQPRPDARPFTEKHPAMLSVALVLVIGLLGWIAWRSQGRAAETL